MLLLFKENWKHGGRESKHYYFDMFGILKGIVLYFPTEKFPFYFSA